MAHILDHDPFFVQVSLKSHRCGGQLGFNLHLLQREETKDRLLSAWKQRMEDNAYQKVGLKVMKALDFVKKESDSIIKNLKAYSKKLCEE
jgi:hypothetical protein